MDRNWLVQQLVTGNVDTAAVEEYVKTTRPDLLPALQLWQLSNSEAARGKGTGPRHTSNRHTDSDDVFLDSEDAIDVGGRILHSLDAIHKELRRLRLLTQQQQDVNFQLAQALETIADVIDIASTEPGPEIIEAEYPGTRRFGQKVDSKEANKYEKTRQITVQNRQMGPSA